MVVFHALSELQLAEVQLCPPGLYPAPHQGWALSKQAGRAAVHPYGARSHGRERQQLLGWGSPFPSPGFCSFLPAPGLADSDGSPSSSSLANLG